MAAIPPHNAALYTQMQQMLGVWIKKDFSFTQTVKESYYDKPDADKLKQLKAKRKRLDETVELPF